MVPDALISRAPPPAPAGLLVPSAPVPPAHPPRRGCSVRLLATAPPALPLLPLDVAPYPPAVPKPPPPPPVLVAAELVPVDVPHALLFPPGPEVEALALASIAPPESIVTLPSTKKITGSSPASSIL